MSKKRTKPVSKWMPCVHKNIVIGKFSHITTWVEDIIKGLLAR